MGIDPTRQWMVIKPSGMTYEAMTVDDMVVVRIEDGAVVEGGHRPSSDTPAHRVLYQAFPAVGGIVHTHSRWATTFAQAGAEIPMMGTTHADFAVAAVGCTRELSPGEVEQDFEENTGRTIVELITESGLESDEMPAALVRGHGPFCWAETATRSVQCAVILEEVAAMAYHALQLNSSARLNEAIRLRHYRRKHGPDAYYGQANRDA